MKYIIISLMLSCIANADQYLVDASHDSTVHATAHIGTSYIINTFVYGVMYKGLKCDRTDSIFFALFTTLVIGATYKLLENPDSSAFGTSMLYNGIGAAASIGTILMFRF